ncbi:MAG: prepilin-type N-terminal cleavage/methylation domain-containing protein [Opitutaceae bacterium]|jgi:prepilin-type N-terminal cleavage/methylation domain-containing protein|nr:prepilin-type N-terminal cleavage/methylation domain-containing protein [Opitutaceae bacterium]
MKHTIKSRKGFTLVEMLGVLAIIAILISVISVGVLSAINRARIVATISNFKNLETAALSYVALNESAGQLPLTKADFAIPSRLNLARNSGAGANFAVGSQGPLHLEAIFLAAGTLERYPNWRVGRDALQSGQALLNEAGWNRKASSWADVNANGVAVANYNDWANYVRAECAPSAPSIVPGTYDATGMNDATGVNFRIDGSTNLSPSVRVGYVVIPGMSLKDAEKISEEINGALNDMDIAASSPVLDQTAGRFAIEGSAPQADGTVTGYYYLGTF